MPECDGRPWQWLDIRVARCALRDARRPREAIRLPRPFLLAHSAVRIAHRSLDHGLLNNPPSPFFTFCAAASFAACSAVFFAASFIEGLLSGCAAGAPSAG